MNLKFGVSKFKDIKAQALIKFVPESGLDSDAVIKELDRLSNGTIKRIRLSGEFNGELNRTVVLYGVPGIGSDKVILVGLGAKSLKGYDEYRQGAGTVSTLQTVRSSKSAAMFLSGTENPDCAAAIIEGFLLGGFKMDDYLTGKNDKRAPRQTLTYFSEDNSFLTAVKKCAFRGQIAADSVILVRRFVQHPANILTPRKFAREIQSLGRQHKFRCQILDEKKIAAEKMGALMAVAKGSNEPPRLVIMKYNGSRASARPVVIVGKGITFDTGGICLKPIKDMDEMKGDMQGAAIVVGTMVAAARLKLPLNLVGVVPLAENMPSSRATRPSDIVISRKGKTIEIINTDAEGRLILADALDFADKFKPQAVIDIATLTGGAKYILGRAGIPFVSNNQNIVEALYAASDRCSEKVWQLPVWDEHRDMMKSSIADLKNSAGKYAGTIAASAFLENFIGDWPWAHIDIAAVDIEKGGRPYIPKGATGMGQRLLVELLSHWKKP